MPKIDIKRIENAVKDIVSCVSACDTVDRDLLDTPKRVTESFKEMFSGYDMDPRDILRKTFSESNIDTYHTPITLHDINFVSTCEHHLLPITGVASVSYIPNKRIVGISKLARIVDLYARRLQMQERLTIQIANTIQEVLEPLGVAVYIKASHFCMIIRGIQKHSSSLHTSHFTGQFLTDHQACSNFTAQASSCSR